MVLHLYLFIYFLWCAYVWAPVYFHSSNCRWWWQHAGANYCDSHSGGRHVLGCSHYCGCSLFPKVILQHHIHPAEHENVFNIFFQSSTFLIIHFISKEEPSTYRTKYREMFCGESKASDEICGKSGYLGKVWTERKIHTWKLFNTKIKQPNNILFL